MTTPFQKKRINLGEVTRLQKLLHGASLHTVCESAKCPNIGECFCRGVATFLIAGDICTRGCRFCAVNKGKPLPLDNNEPERIAETVKKLGLKYVVVTSVTRDDLSDGGAQHFVETVSAIRTSAPGTKVEVLVPDFKGDAAAATLSFSCKPDVYAHNLETVPRLYSEARAGADYRRSLTLIAQANAYGLTTKSGIMLGLGEKEEEVLAVLRDLRENGCNLLTLGQYLAPTAQHYPVKEYISQERFDHYKERALTLGFTHCASAPYVRSSYNADQMV